MPDTPPIRLRYPGTCTGCGRDIAAGERAHYDRPTRQLTCAACPPGPVLAGGMVECGRAGASAQAEHDRRRAAREGRAQARFGALGGLAARFSGDSPSERAWAKGALGERKTAQRLQRQLDGHGVLLLHDRRIPPGRANIDHLAVGPGGVTVIDAKHLHGKVRRELRGGLLRPRTEHLLLNGRDRTSLVEGVHRQLKLVRQLVGPDVEVRGALCLVDVDGLPLLSTVTVAELPLLGPKSAAKLARRPGPLTAEQITELHARLALALPAA